MGTEMYTLGPIHPIPENYAGTALVLHNIEKIPPHIGVVFQGLYYSLSVKGVKTEIPFQRVADEIKNKSSVCAIVEIEVPFYIQSPLRYFNNYTALSSNGDETCLSPIRDWLEHEMEEEVELRWEIAASQFVFELIEALRNEHRVGNVYGLNTTKTELVLPRYTWQDIMNEIERKEQSDATR
ncbi:MAG: hypothetical protein ACHQF2_01990 [Flavobacteriales bacterium]